MFFYRIKAEITPGYDTTKDAELQSDCISAVESFFDRNGRRKYLFVFRCSAEHLFLGGITDLPLEEETVIGFLKELRYASSVGSVTIREISMKETGSRLHTAYLKDYITSDEEVLMHFGLLSLSQNRFRGIEEIIVPAVCDRKELHRRACSLLCEQAFDSEAGRIYAGAKISGVAGQPVFYLVTGETPELRREITMLTVSALLGRGRLRSGRVTIASMAYSLEYIRKLYDACTDATIIIDCANENDEYGDIQRCQMQDITDICALARSHRRDTLTIFLLPCGQSSTRDQIIHSMGNIPLVELHENTLSFCDAKKYLRCRAKEAGLKGDSRLYPADGEENAFTRAVLDKRFDEWYAHKLRCTVYPQYAESDFARALRPAAENNGDAFAELDGMIGLTEAKQVITRAIDYYKAQKLFGCRGMSTQMPAMHMVFTGNPGTAKTTVARLFARIMKDNGLLANGELLEVGRSDLVGKYVGWTANIVKNAFCRARGGVLFIDEAYSLVDDREGLYGDEAINTIVQEMENHRDDVVVIFAGYPDKMETFLRRNPGLRSRIAFHVPFSDYTADELCEIADYTARKNSLSYGSETRDKLHSIFENAVLTEDFGNGRFVRNIIEQAQMEQAGRLVRMGIDSVTDNDIATLLPEDIVEPPMSSGPVSKALGF